jgi:rhamnopyranosyl-N-acetylglucosaminyl-diphospho-decaprenol beta-1,3/1,4-galactofuranosyltransferase
MRAKKYGSQIFIVRDSILNHPLSDTYKISIGYRSLTNLRLIPWKRYYDTRNRIFIAKKYYGLRLYTQTIPASFLRLMATLIYETNRLKQAKAFWAGLYDGMLGKQGKRHDYWEL